MSQHRVVTLKVEVSAPEDFTDHDLHDVLRFHLDLGELTQGDLDISAVRILDSQVVGNTYFPDGRVFNPEGKRIDHLSDGRD